MNETAVPPVVHLVPPVAQIVVVKSSSQQPDITEI